MFAASDSIRKQHKTSVLSLIGETGQINLWLN
jgi:hypothetical protein